MSGDDSETTVSDGDDGDDRPSPDFEGQEALGEYQETLTDSNEDDNAE